MAEGLITGVLTSCTDDRTDGNVNPSVGLHLPSRITQHLGHDPICNLKSSAWTLSQDRQIFVRRTPTEDSTNTPDNLAF